jgi:hypothetical protein
MFGDSHAMRRALQDIRKDHGVNRGADVDAFTVANSIAKLAKGQPLTPGELRDCAFGIATEIDDVGRIIDSPSLTQALLERVSQQTMHPRRHDSILAGLAGGYFAYRPDDYNVDASPWTAVRDWIARRLADAASTARAIAQLREHRNLFTDNPCGRYADPQRSAADIEVLRHDLGITPNSWVFGEILLTQTRFICQYDDAAFRDEIDGLAEAAREFPLFEGDVLILLLNRYATASFRVDPHEALKEMAVSRWGNPLDSSTRGAWAVVSSDARKMVEGWVKRYVIEAFFDVISARYSTDSRRATFWLAYAESIDDLHIFFGENAYYNGSAKYAELRKLMAGKYTRMTGDLENNGFLMTMRGVGFVEFSNHANACYVYDADDLPVRLDARLVTISQIKDQVRCLKRLIHRDAWELSFEQEIRRLTRVTRSRRQ